MRKTSLVVLSVLLISALLAGGCGYTMFTSPTVGGLYTGTTSPSYGTAETKDISIKKKGFADCKAVLAIAAWGDCSVEAAAKAGGIKKVHHVDHNTFTVLIGVYSKYTTIVYGE